MTPLFRLKFFYFVIWDLNRLRLDFEILHRFGRVFFSWNPIRIRRKYININDAKRNAVYYNLSYNIDVVIFLKLILGLVLIIKYISHNLSSPKTTKNCVIKILGKLTMTGNRLIMNYIIVNHFADIYKNCYWEVSGLKYTNNLFNF